MTDPDKNWLDDIAVASPCSASWDAMQGDDRCRFCEQCSLHVYDLSSMSRQAAEDLVRERTDGSKRLCVRFTRRTDGTVLTQDCPVGLRTRLRRTASRLVAMAATVVTFFGCRSETEQVHGEGVGQSTGSNTDSAIASQIRRLKGEMTLQGDVEIPEGRVLQGRIQLSPPEESDKHK